MVLIAIAIAILLALLVDVFIWRVIPFVRAVVRAKRQRLPEDWFNFIQ